MYKQAEVIVLDEATNALDSSKENLVMKALKGLNKNITVIMVAHRLSTLDNCTQVIDFSADKEISDS